VPRRFVAPLLAILAVAAIVRVAFIVFDARHDERVYDAAYYELQARVLADGQGYVDPFSSFAGQEHRAGEAADHPPLTVFALVPVAWVGERLGVDDETSRLAMRFEIALVGLGVVVLVALLGREVAGDRTGLIAAVIAAVYPYLWVNDGLIMSEAFAAAAVVAAMLLTLRLCRRHAPGLGIAFGLGAVCGVAALARAELVLLAPLLALPLLASLRAVPLDRRVGVVGIVALGALVVVGPWVAFNLGRFDEPTFISTNDGIALLGSNCDPVFSGRFIGLTDLDRCIPRHPPPGDQSQVSQRYRQDAIDYVRDGREGQFLRVEAARIGRDWGLFRPMQMLDWNEGEGRPRWVTGLGMVFYYPLVALAIGGVVVLRRRRVRQWPLLMPPIVVTLGTLVSYGQTRFRVPAEPSIVVLAAVALGALAARRWPERPDPAPPAIRRHQTGHQPVL
jgi:4-amino-4-deoxy-L-arabinose transferase-like glycosyltransferase